MTPLLEECIYLEEYTFDLKMGERGKSLDSGHNKNSDSDRSSNSDYSDDDSSCASERSPTVSTRSTNTREKCNKPQNLKSLAHYQGKCVIPSSFFTCTPILKLMGSKPN